MEGLVYTWSNDTQSPRLTPAEIDLLFDASYGLMQAGELNRHFSKGASTPIWWERLPNNRS